MKNKIFYVVLLSLVSLTAFSQNIEGGAGIVTLSSGANPNTIARLADQNWSLGESLKAYDAYTGTSWKYDDSRGVNDKWVIYATSGSSSTLADISDNSTGTAEQTFVLDAATDMIIEKSDGADILTVDGTNGIVGINSTPILGRDLTLTNYQFLRGYIGSDLYIHNDGSTTDFFAGQNAGLSTSATNSNGIGKNALLSSSGSNNDAMGVSAGLNNTGSKNVFFGNSTGIGNSGSDNVMVGYFAGRNKAAGVQNTYLGSNAGINSTSSANTCIGFYAGADNGNSFLTAVGQSSGQNSNGDDNSFFGYAAGASAVGDNLLGLGAYSLRSSNGDDNIGIGHATSEEIVGDNNVAIGRYSLEFNKGSNNNAVGVNAMRNAGTGTNNVAVGYRAGDNMHGNDNTALGGSSLPLQLTGVTLVVSSVDVPNDRVTIASHGLIIGDKYPLYVVSSTIGGLGAGNTYNFKVIDANILEVSVVSISSAGSMTLERYAEISNSTWIGAGAYPTKSNQVVLGDADVIETILKGNVGIEVNNPAERLHIDGNLRFHNEGGYGLQFGSSSNKYIKHGFPTSNVITYSSYSGHSFRSYDGASYAEVLRISGSGSKGRLGIYESSPLATLHMNGGVGSLSKGLAFGDGDSGLFESADDEFDLQFGGSGNVIKFTNSFTQFGDNGGSSPQVRHRSPTAILPNLLPLGDDPDTGIGRAAEDQLSLIAGGVEGIRISEGFENIDIDIKGSVNMQYSEKTATYTTVNGDYTINCTANTFTITLQASSGITGRILNIKNTGAGTITLDANAAELIDNSLTTTVTADNSTTIQCTGSGWIILSN